MDGAAHDQRLARARVALDGLSVGDAFGERFFFASAATLASWLERRTIDRPGPWRWTDDTAMALALVETLEHEHELEPDRFAERLASRWQAEPWRGYGPGAHRLLAALHEGDDWRTAARAMFGGQGSFGNGSAMRIAPLGAYFADAPLEWLVEQARRSAAVTHAHSEGEAGAIAIALAAQLVWQLRDADEHALREQLWVTLLEHVPASETRAGLARARELARASTFEAADVLGNGSRISCQDTVPFCVWAIARHPRDYAAALWTTVSALGDRDTTCAIVGGVVALASEITPEWLARREPLEGISIDELPV